MTVVITNERGESFSLEVHDHESYQKLNETLKNCCIGEVTAEPDLSYDIANISL